MSTITLTDGDFGEATVSFGAETFYLPDRLRPGLTEAVPLAAVLEMEQVGGDRSAQIGRALKLSASGFLSAGPIGLAAGILAVGQAKDVVFAVVLEDSRRFTATADARTYAELHAAQIAARGAARLADAPHPADDIIAKYLAALGPDTPAAPVAPSGPPPEPIREADRAAAGVERPAFGRRRAS